MPPRTGAILGASSWIWRLKEDLGRHGISLERGYLALTGTPLGLHAVKPGDQVIVSVDGRDLVGCSIAY